MTPQQFIAKWKPVTLSERSACQQHFLDLCAVLGQPTPADADPTGEWYTFERGVAKTGGGDGWADVWMRNHFGWEYKGKHKNLPAAYDQLLLYREALENPPLLVVCDMDRFEVHTNFTGTAKRVHAFDLDGLSVPARQFGRQFGDNSGHPLLERHPRSNLLPIHELRSVLSMTSGRRRGCCPWRRDRAARHA